MKKAVILGSTRPKYRLGERVSKWVMADKASLERRFGSLLDEFFGLLKHSKLQ